jgi:hypothetical protein
MIFQSFETLNVDLGMRPEPDKNTRYGGSVLLYEKSAYPDVVLTAAGLNAM